MTKIAIAVGHSETKPGAVNKTTALSEFKFNSVVAAALKLALSKKYDVRIFFRPPNLDNIDAIRKVVREINIYYPGLAIELHCNAANSSASGAEVLFWYKNKKTEQIAEFGANEFAIALSVPSRGSKPIKRGDRGSVFLGETRCPAIITEPFFISNDNDLTKALVNFNRLISAYLSMIQFGLNIL